MISGTVGDIAFPDPDRAVLIRAVLVVAATIIATYLVRGERALATFTIGLGTTVLGLMALRTIH